MARECRLAIVILAAAHAFAALYHHYALKDRVLVRMLSARDEGLSQRRLWSLMTTGWRSLRPIHPCIRCMPHAPIKRVRLAGKG